MKAVERLVRQKLETLVEEKRRQLGVMKEALEREKRRREAAEETIRFLTKSSHSTDIVRMDLEIRSAFVQPCFSNRLLGCQRGTTGTITSPNV